MFGIRFAIACAAFAVVSLRVTFAAADESRPSRPNVLVIMSDEHNASVLGCYGNTVVRTPNLDRLAKQGVVFESAYTNSPLCVPSRLSFTSGKYASRVSAWNNDCSLPSDECPSIARTMNAAGYESYLCGKMHYAAGRSYGFTRIGEQGHNADAMTGRGSRRAADDLAAAKERSGRFDAFRVADDSSVMKHDRAVTKGTVEFLSARRTGDKPFFLLAGFLAPHFPLVVPAKYHEAYKGRVPMPNVPPGYLETLPLNYRHLRAGFKMTDVDADTVRFGRELYFGLTQWMDEQVGQVLAALEKSGLADNTVVIYTADHGENMGEHGLWWKNCVYDTAAHVPLIISWPKRWPGGQRREGACSLVDVVQTIAQIGGGKAPSDWNGDSLCGWLDDPKTPWKDIAVSEYYAHHIASGYAMIRRGDYKYVCHTRPDERHEPQRELYDLRADPGEMHNLAAAADQQDRIREMHSALAKEVGEDPEKTESRARDELSRGYADKGSVKKAPGRKAKKAAAE